MSRNNLFVRPKERPEELCVCVCVNAHASLSFRRTVIFLFKNWCSVFLDDFFNGKEDR